jgi:putative Holliday junction resolvase
MGGVLAIDYGAKKCGFASTDALRIAREPGAVVRHEGRDECLLAHVSGLLAERDLSTVVVGLPTHADGRASALTERVVLFAARLRERFPALTVELLDERLTTKEAEARLRALGRRGRMIRAERDAWSALVLLEDWLSTH